MHARRRCEGNRSADGRRWEGADLESAARRANALIAVELGRRPHRTHVERLAALVAAGRVNDEAAFAAMRREWRR